MKSLMNAFILSLLLLSYGQCSLISAIQCSFLKASYMIMITSATITGKLDSALVDKVRKVCGFSIAFDPLPENLKALHQLRNDASDITNKLFGIQFDFKATLLNKEEKIYQDEKFSITAKLSVDTKTTIKPEGDNDGVAFTLKEGVVINKDGVKASFDNPIVSEIEKATGFNLKDMSTNLEAKLAPLSDATVKVKATLNQIDITVSESKNIDKSTKINGDITYSIKRNEIPQSPATSPVIEKITSKFNELDKETDIPIQIKVMAGAAGMIAIAAASPQLATVTAVTVIAIPVISVFGKPTVY